MAYWWLLRKPTGLDLAAVPLAAWPIGLGLGLFGQVSLPLAESLSMSHVQFTAGDAALRATGVALPAALPSPLP